MSKPYGQDNPLADSRAVVGHSKVHGIAELPWDHASVPTRVWKATQQLPNGCWVSTLHYTNIWKHRAVVIKAVSDLRHEDYSVQPTCSDYRCINPAHMCVTKKTALSLRKNNGNDSTKG